MPMTTNAFRMADRMAGGRLLEIIRASLADGSSLEHIAQQLYADFGITVSGKTLRRWIDRFGGDEAQVAEAAS